ncbi:MAG: response regulator [Thermoproteota archaeon]|nr:response regulator [Thermoproteota archaeon]
MSLLPYSILVVDDEPSLASLFRQFFVKLGFDAISFTDPLLALEHFKQNYGKYSVILTDMRMPSMSGIDLANKIRKLNSSVRILLVTAFDNPDLASIENYKTARIEQIVKKPIRLSVLKQIVEKNLCMDGKSKKPVSK